MTTPSPRGRAAVRALACSLLFGPVAAAGTLYVDAQLATGAGDGSSWANAFRGPGGLQAALAVAAAGDQVFVADGVYLPSSSGDRTAAFALENDVTIYGSFAGGETGPDQRPPFGTADSVLSGDLNGDDGSALLGDNSFHLITTAGTDATAVLDGFVVRGGNANSAGGNRDRGAGILCLSAVSPTLRHCRFVDNVCTFGGAAGYISTSAAPTFTDCSFEDGDGGSFGGAFDIAGGGAVRFERCLFLRNTALRGGALELFSSVGIVVSNCVFVENTASGPSGGGGIWFGNGGSARVRNCTLVSNSAPGQTNAGIRKQGTGGDLQVHDTILWGNTGPSGAQGAANQVNAATPVFYSLVQGGFAGTGNVDGDPAFVDAAALDFTPGPGSPAIDAGDNGAVQAGSTLDWAGRPRFADVLAVADTGVGPAPVVDMGAFEAPSVWLDLGGALAGSAGLPQLVLSGPLTPASLNTAALTSAAPNALAYVFAGFSLASIPLQGGVLLPSPDLIRKYVTSPGGTLDIVFPWPTGLPSGFATYYQVWITDAGGPFGFAASNGVQGTTP